jgi:hypothetical protein
VINRQGGSGWALGDTAPGGWSTRRQWAEPGKEAAPAAGLARRWWAG